MLGHFSPSCRPRFLFHVLIKGSEAKAAFPITKAICSQLSFSIFFTKVIPVRPSSSAFHPTGRSKISRAAFLVGQLKEPLSKIRTLCDLRSNVVFFPGNEKLAQCQRPSKNPINGGPEKIAILSLQEKNPVDQKINPAILPLKKVEQLSCKKK